jgi:hypothetical protein
VHLQVAASVPGLEALAHAAHAVHLPVAVSGPGLPGLAAAEVVGLDLIAERYHHPGAVAANVSQLVRPAGAALDAEYPAALELLSETLPAFPVEQGRAILVQSAAESAV